MQGEVSSLAWDLFQNSGQVQYYALYLALKQRDEDEQHKEEEREEMLR